MRQVFTSARIENAEAVAKLLADEGIEVRVENGRTFRSSIRGNFSYREQVESGPRAAVWVVRSDDQPRARQLLRDAGLLEATPANPNSFLPGTGHAARAASPKKRSRLRFGLLVVAAVALALWLNQFRNPGWDLPEPRQAAPAATALDPSLQRIDTPVEAVHAIPVPPALAATLAARAAQATAAQRVCLAIDGGDAAAAALEILRGAGVDALPPSACAADAGALHVAVRDYRTDGSGTGTVEVATRTGAGEPAVERLDVRREETEWSVLGTP